MGTATSTGSKYLQITHAYIKAVEQGATGDALAKFLHPDVTHYDLPNRFNPSGKIRDHRGMLASAERGQKVMRGQKYDILSVIEQGNSVAVEIDWIGKLAITVAGIPAKGEMHARVAIFLEFQDDQIVLQRDYVCYDPF
ncbi:MAG: nuclear transport factor 2 family protein [Terriglobales bacterium]